MLVKLAKQRGVTLLNVVRRADQVATLVWVRVKVSRVRVCRVRIRVS